jgi:hypothetical protein
MTPNPSIERTSKSSLRELSAAAHVDMQHRRAEYGPQSEVRRFAP